MAHDFFSRNENLIPQMMEILIKNNSKSNAIIR